MKGGLDTTFRVLAETPNEAATDVLIPALDSVHRAVHEEALRALLARRDLAGHWAILRRWTELNQRWKMMIAQRPGRLDRAIKAGLVGNDETLCLAACDAAYWIAQYDLLPQLLRNVEERGGARGEAAAVAILGLAERLYEELVAPRDYAKRRDPQSIRHSMVSALEGAVGRFEQHQRLEILEAYLLLANRDAPPLKKILHDPADKKHASLLGVLNQSPRSGVIRLILSFLDDPHPPCCISRLISSRCDREFIKHFLQKLAGELSHHAKQNLHQINSLGWLCEGLDFLCELSEEEQQGAATLAVVSDIDRADALQLLQFLVQRGQLRGRRAAAAYLPQFEGPLINELTLLALEDEDPIVLTSILNWIKQRRIPNATGRMLELLDNPHANVREAVRNCLSDFQFKRFLSSFNSLDETARCHMGQLVRRVDPLAIDNLRQELTAPARGRQLRGLELAPIMDAVGEVEDEILRLLTEEDAFIRAAAIRSLAHRHSWKVYKALQAALEDRNATVREAAEQALQQMAGKPLLGPAPYELPETAYSDPGPLPAAAGQEEP